MQAGPAATAVAQLAPAVEGWAEAWQVMEVELLAVAEATVTDTARCQEEV
jgi:hypothetical protein